MIETLKAVGGEATSEVAVRFDLTVAPDDMPAYRVEITQNINLAVLPDYRPRGIVVVQYPPDRPWEVRIVKRPTPDWEEVILLFRADLFGQDASAVRTGGDAVGGPERATHWLD